MEKVRTCSLLLPISPALTTEHAVSRSVDFMIKFYGAHFRLLLSSSRLQLAQLQSSNMLGECVQSCLTSGDYIYRVLLDKLGPFQQLYYVQDSIHVMTAYTTILMIKILLSMQAHITPALERAIIETILEASDVFGTYLRSSCTDQADFLKSAAKEFRRWKRQWQLGTQHTQNTAINADVHRSSSTERGNGVGISPPEQRHGGMVAQSDLGVLVEGAEHNHQSMGNVDLSAAATWETLFGATGFEFDHWSSFDLSAPRV